MLQVRLDRLGCFFSQLGNYVDILDVHPVQSMNPSSPAYKFFHSNPSHKSIQAAINQKVIHLEISSWQP